MRLKRGGFFYRFFSNEVVNGIGLRNENCSYICTVAGANVWAKLQTVVGLMKRHCSKGSILPVLKNFTAFWEKKLQRQHCLLSPFYRTHRALLLKIYSYAMENTTSLLLNQHSLARVLSFHSVKLNLERSKVTNKAAQNNCSLGLQISSKRHAFWNHKCVITPATEFCR